MAVTAIVVEAVERDTINAKQAARIPPVCKILPTAIETREKIPRFMVAEGSTDSPFKPSFVRQIVSVNSTRMKQGCEQTLPRTSSKPTREERKCMTYPS